MALTCDPFEIAIEDFAESRQFYEPNTAVLRTQLFDRSGQGLEITDFAPRFFSRSRYFRPMLLVRRMVHRERPTTIVIYFCITSCVVALITIPFGWVMPTPHQAMLLVLAGLAGGVGQILMTTSYRHADMSTIAPFEYTSMLLGLTIGYLVFGDVPTMQMMIGSMIVIGAGIFIIYREHQLGLERKRAKKASSHQS